MRDLIDEVAAYYSNKLAEHGETPQGVDWNGEESQLLRFAQLSRVIEPGRPCSINDLGCGYGAFFEYLCRCPEHIDYCGIDASPDMVSSAQLRHKGADNACFVVSDRPNRHADYGVASGIFNVRQTRSDEEWRQYILDVLKMLNQTSRQGFAFNCLTSYSDEHKMRSDLYYADPLWLFDLCKRQYSKDVALLHDYGLYEFTILVRKSASHT
ncbi:trans-aconitate 2-methyltransferase [uncultured Thiohalocapsa sp.]|uniref:class I SAM-dependent methyltransferase n=1 Tax=uncultured Thiohalocapsa sp. TaxID=768990 RepID=UPI0025DA89F7|nr:class I SAM-dependent methyltransferase [uncultured Thiohalocapsa sp.]